jgi:hypothetical protein
MRYRTFTTSKGLTFLEKLQEGYAVRKGWWPASIRIAVRNCVPVSITKIELLEEDKVIATIE